MVLAGFFRCPCGKAHTFGGITRTSLCACGRSLWQAVTR